MKYIEVNRRSWRAVKGNIGVRNNLNRQKDLTYGVVIVRIMVGKGCSKPTGGGHDGKVIGLFSVKLKSV